MKMPRLPKILTSFLLAALLLLTACAPQPPSRFDQAQQESTQRGVKAVSKDATAGGEFNKFFPQSSGGYKVVYSQEKKGFAQAKLKQNGQEMATLSISDVSSNPNAAKKYQNSSEKIGGYPAANQGRKGTGVLVKDRYQVKVLSSSTAFTESDRKAWLKKFDLSGLASLK